MTSSILFAGGEDIDFQVLGSLSWTVVTTAGLFRSGYARAAIQCNNGDLNNVFIRSVPNFTSSAFWTSARLYTTTNGSGQSSSGCHIVRWCDSAGVPRLRLRSNGTGNAPYFYFVVEKVNAAGAATQLGSASIDAFPSAGFKFDAYINYGVSGSITIYKSGNPIFTYSGDVTTDGVASLACVDLGQPSSYNTHTGTVNWSEVICSTSDTRAFSLVTQTATANGNTHNWDSGTAANIAATAVATGQAAPNASGTAGQIQEYQVTPAIPSGSFGVVAVVQKAQAIIGATGPSKFDFMVRSGSTDYTSSPDTAGNGYWTTYAYAWDLNPNTGVAWSTADLTNASTLFNMGLKSVA